MECPYCHGGLEPGTYVSGHGSLWVPRGVRIGLVMSHRKVTQAGGFRVGRPRTFYEAEAWYCRTCDRLTVFDAKAK